MLSLVQSLCSDLTGSECRAPRLSDWCLVAPAQGNIGVDIADVASGGAGVVLPVNVKAYGSHFLTGLERRSRYGGMSSQMVGYGMGGGVGAGWGIPFVGTRGVGKLPDGIKKKILKRIGKATQSKIEEYARDLVFSGVSGGTRIIAGPDVKGELTTDDFHGSFVTVSAFSANFVVNGVSFGLVIVSKSRPVLQMSDLVYARAFGLMGGVGLATSLDLEASGIVYRVGFL